MSVILVVEQDASTAERIREVLRSSDRSVMVVGSRAQALSQAEREVPSLLLAGSDLPDVAELLAGFSRSQGGPGAVVVVPAAEVTETTAADFRADEILAVPFTDTGLVQLVERCLKETSDRQPKTPAVSGAAEQLTSEDIFGDVLAEVEAEAKQVTPAAKAVRPERPMEDIERKLEKTLSGVIPTAGKTKRSRDRKRLPESPSDAEIDDLLDQTLSSLNIPTRAKKASSARQQAPVATPPADTPPPEAAEPEHKAPDPDAPVDFEPPPALPSLSEFEPFSAPTLETEPQPRSTTEPEESEPAASEGLPASEGLAESQELPAEPTALAESPSASSEPIEPSFGSAPPPPDSPSPLSDLRAGGDQFATQALPMLDLLKEANGESFGDYTLLDRIAIGGMAEVWRARRRGVEGFQKTVAIKKILSHLTGSADFVTMFIDEAKLAAQLSHNNIIQIYDLGKVGSDFFIAMEYVEGKDLRSILSAASGSSQPVPHGLALYIISAVARALDYAHRKRDFEHQALGLVHRDVSPQNVLISYEGEIKLCDFGIVKAVAKASTTQMGALKGKLQYMSPEQAWGKSVDARSDIFSLGSVFYEVLTGTKLFSGESEIGVLDAVRGCQIRSPREIVPGLPEAIERIVLKALAKTPEERYQTAGDMEQELQEAIDELKPTPSQNDLAGYLRGLFSGQEAETREGAPAAADPASAAEPPALAAAAAESAVQPPPPSQGRGGGLKWLALALVAIAVLVGIAFMVSRPKAPEVTPAATGPTSPGTQDGQVAPEQPTAGEPSPVPAAADTTGPGLSSETEGSETTLAEGSEEGGSLADEGLAENATGDQPPGDPSQTVLPANAGTIDIEQLVNEELSNRAERLRKDFEAEKKRIEKELAKTQTSDEPAAEETAPEPDPETGGDEENESGADENEGGGPPGS